MSENNTILLRTMSRSWPEKHLLCGPLLPCCHVPMLCPRLQSQGAIWGDWLKQSWETRILYLRSLENTHEALLSTAASKEVTSDVLLPWKPAPLHPLTSFPPFHFCFQLFILPKSLPRLAGQRRASCETQISCCMPRVGCRCVSAASARAEPGAFSADGACSLPTVCPFIN